MRPTPYIGITGISLPHEPAQILQGLELQSDAKLMFGSCVSHKTLLGGTATKHPKRYPDVHMLEEQMSQDPRVMNVIHFNTREPEQLLMDLNQAQFLAGPLCHGFQLNMPWPYIPTLKEYKDTHDKEHNIVILQCGKRALEEVHNNPTKLAARVNDYLGVIDYVLIDASGGEGHEFDINKTLEYFAALEQFGNLGFGVAGGLGTHSLSRLWPIWQKYSNFSIDAESGVRNDDDMLVVHEASTYIVGGDQMFVQRALAHQRKNKVFS
jgi:hypothetical protein